MTNGGYMANWLWFIAGIVIYFAGLYAVLIGSVPIVYTAIPLILGFLCMFITWLLVAANDAVNAHWCRRDDRLAYQRQVMFNILCLIGSAILVVTIYDKLLDFDLSFSTKPPPSTPIKSQPDVKDRGLVFYP